MDAMKDSIQVLIQNHEIRLKGVLTFNTSAHALALIKKHLDSVVHNPVNLNPMTLNLSEVTRSDSAGLPVLSGTMREAKKNNIVLKITNVPEKLLHLAQLSGLNAIF